MRRIVPVLLFTLLPLGITGPAQAAETGYHGDPLSGVPSLITGTYGTVQHTDVTTSVPADNADSGYVSECGDGSQLTEGAAVYKATAPAGARISIAVTEAEAGQGLCRVELFRSSSGALNDLYDVTHRTPYLVGSSDCPLTTAALATCKLAWTLPEQDTYFVVFWPAGDGNPDNFAQFTAITGVLEKTTTSLGISGYFGMNGSCYRVEAGKSFLARARVSPGDANGMVRFTIRKRDAEGNYNVVGEYNRTVSSGAASQSFKPSFGRYSVRATYRGTLEHAPSSSTSRCIHVVARSVVTQRITGYYTTSADYYVFHGGDTITVRAKVGPAPATGTVRFRVDRENNDTSYTYLRSYTRTLVNGVATLTFSMGYTSKTLPFYRIRSEYLGDDLHFSGNTTWRCIWIRK